MAIPSCVGTDPEMWFSLDPMVVDSCLTVCASCPVRAVCLAGAVARREMWGVWGGRLFLPRSGYWAALLYGRLSAFERVAAA